MSLKTSISFEAHFWVRTTNEEVIYLGRRGGPLKQSDIEEEFTALLSELSSEYDTFLQFNSHLSPESNASISSHIDRKVNVIMIDLWLADHDKEMELTAKYLGMNPNTQKVKMGLEAHCWKLDRPAHLIEVDIILAFMINSFKNREQTFKQDCLLRFMMFMDTPYDYPYVYGYFRSLDQVTVCK